jgi:type I restriction enzyme M protein
VRVHTTDLVAGEMEIALPQEPREGVSLAMPGDILLARVGRNLHRKIALVTAGAAPFTDCVFRLRVPEEWLPETMAMLVAGGGAAVEAIARGTGVRHLVREDVLALRIGPQSGSM